jgi:hypothetical protein
MAEHRANARVPGPKKISIGEILMREVQVFRTVARNFLHGCPIWFAGQFAQWPEWPTCPTGSATRKATAFECR